MTNVSKDVFNMLVKKIDDLSKKIDIIPEIDKRLVRVEDSVNEIKKKQEEQGFAFTSLQGLVEKYKEDHEGRLDVLESAKKNFESVIRNSNVQKILWIIMTILVILVFLHINEIKTYFHIP